MTLVAIGPADAVAYSAMPPRSATTLGIAVDTANDSNAPSATSATMPRVTTRYSAANGPRAARVVPGRASLIALFPTSRSS